MAWRGYGNKGYPTYSNVPAQEGGYTHVQKQPTNWYVVETTTIERIRTPGTRYINFGDQGYNHGPNTYINPKYAPKDRHEGYEPYYGSDNENSSPSGNQGRGSLPYNNRRESPLRNQGRESPPRNKGRESPPRNQGRESPPRNQGRESPPRNQGRESPPRNNGQESPPRNQGRESFMDKFRNKVQIKTSLPVKTSDLSSPVKNHPSEEAHPTKIRNLVGPYKHQPTSPEHKYPPKEAHMTRNKSLSGPNKYKSSSPERSYPLEEAHLIRNKSLPGPNKYQPTNVIHNYPSEDAHLIRNKSLPGPNKYQPTNTMHDYPSNETHLIRTRNLSGPNMYQPSSPRYNHHSDEDQPIRTRNLSGLNNHNPSIPGSKYGQFQRFSSPKNHWQSAGPPMTHHPLTNVTNDINEALSFLQESMNHSPHSGQIRTGVFDNFSPHPQLIEPEWQYGEPAFFGATNFQTNIIDSQEAIRKYQGTRVP